MFNKLNIKTLAFIFVALLLIIAINQWVKRSGDDRNFRENLVEVDTAKVTSITIVPRGKIEPLILKKSGEEWLLEFGSKTYRTEKASVLSLLGGLKELKSERLVSTDKENWDQYQVTETAGTYVKVAQGNKTKAEFIIGKFSYQQNYQSVTTYARLKDEEEVYAITGFQVMNFNQDLNTLRNKTLGSGSFDKITRITFSYPDSSYTLSRLGNKWVVNGEPVDSTNVYNYLQMVTSVSGNEFTDDNTPLRKPVFSVLVESDAKDVYEIKAFPSENPDRYYVTGTLNPGAIFSESKDGLIGRLFLPVRHFRKK